MRATAEPVGMKLVAFFTLVVAQSGAILLFKLAQIGGAYTFSPASSVALTELVKLVLAASSHAIDVRQRGSAWFPGLSWTVFAHSFGLSCLYTTNNILTFFVLQKADPGTLSLFKSVAPYLCAMLLQLTGQTLSQLQWSCVLIQCCAIAIVQYDITTGMPVLSTLAYALLSLATAITAVSSVWNQLVIKAFPVSLNLMNTVLYSFGVLTSVTCFLVGPAKSTLGFFEGYTWLGVALIFSQALHGLAVAFVYKHADAVVKNFANSSVMAVLVCVSAIWFAFPMNMHAGLAVVIIIVTTYVYMMLAEAAPKFAFPSEDDMAKRLADPKLVPSESRAHLREDYESAAGSDVSSNDGLDVQSGARHGTQHLHPGPMPREAVP